MTSEQITRTVFLRRLIQSGMGALLLAAVSLFSYQSLAGIAVSAVKDLTCLNNRPGASNNYNCTANDFVVSTSFSASNGTSPVCMAGQEFEFIVDVNLTSAQPNRYDVGFFVGQSGNNPGNSTTSQLCSVATFPTNSSPWYNDASSVATDQCGDYPGGSVSSLNTVNKIKVICTADSTSYLQIPYLLVYQNSVVKKTADACTGPATVMVDVGSKCQGGTATVSGVVPVQVGVWMDITKATIPDSSTQSFTYTATAPTGRKVIALTGATLTSTSASGGTYTPADIGSATDTTTFTLKNGETARVFMTIDNSGSSNALTVTESAQTGWDPTAAISCSGVAPTTFSNSTRTMTATLSAAAPSAACTITNTKRPTITMKKISIGDVGSFTFTGDNTWASQTLTTTAANTEVTGTTQILPQYVETTIAETNITGYRLDDLSCIVGGSPVASGTTSYNFLPSYQAVTFDSNVMSPGAEIICTSTSVRRRTLQVIKALNPTADAGKFIISMQYSGVGINTGNTRTRSGTGGHNTSVSTTVDVTGDMTVYEAVGDTSTNLVNYSPSISCNTSPVTSSTGSTSQSFVMPNQDVLCTFTNVRKSASLVLKKQWQVGIPGNSATVSSSGFINNGTSGAVVADSTGNNLGGGSAFTVYSGESGTIAETFNVGTANNYNSSIACTGSSGLSGAILTVQPIDTAIQCIITNARKSANLTVRKQWINSDPGTQVNVQSNGMINTAYSGSSSSGGNTLTTGTSVKAYVTEQGTFSETYAIGSASNFVSSVTCSGTSGFDSATGTLTVNVADTDIICTYSNQAKKPIITVTKNTAVVRDPLNGTNNPKNIPGAVVAYNIEVVNSGPGTVDANTLVISDVIPNNVKLFVGDAGGGAPVSFTDGAISSGLGWVYSGLSNGTDSVDFSNDGGISWNYVPTPDADGYDNNVSHIRFKPTGAMNASSGTNYPSFKVRFLVGVK